MNLHMPLFKKLTSTKQCVWALLRFKSNHKTQSNLCYVVNYKFKCLYQFIDINKPVKFEEFDSGSD